MRGTHQSEDPGERSAGKLEVQLTLTLPDASCPGLQMGNRSLLGGPEKKADFENRETWTRLL